MKRFYSCQKFDVRKDLFTCRTCPICSAFSGNYKFNITSAYCKICGYSLYISHGNINNIEKLVGSPNFKNSSFSINIETSNLRINSYDIFDFSIPKNIKTLQQYLNFTSYCLLRI